LLLASFSHEDYISSCDERKEQIVNEQKKIMVNGAATIETDSPLSPHRAFVVQFREPAGPQPGQFTGRVEHVTSGHATRFQSLDEFLAFLERMTTDEHEQPP
jgi:hypothetical protein